MVRPDTIEGVPEEPGIYLVHCDDPNAADWFAWNVFETPNGLMGVSSYSMEVPEEEFNGYDWSERIEEPTLDVE